MHEIRSSLAILKFISGPRFSFPNSRLSGDLPRRVCCPICLMREPKITLQIHFLKLTDDTAANLLGLSLKNRIEK